MKRKPLPYQAEKKASNHVSLGSTFFLRARSLLPVVVVLGGDWYQIRNPLTKGFFYN